MSSVQDPTPTRRPRRPESLWSAVWASLLLLVLGAEAVAIRRRKLGDTLSEQVWWLDRLVIPSAALRGLWCWLGWHFFIEPPLGKPWHLEAWGDDLVVVGVGMLWGIGMWLNQTVKDDDDEAR